jgi:hypothetical protein|tara:strand:+ start:771 stop:1007 length:237 start_codon:yes stop_codon:yes gene_type:complete
MSQYNEDVAMLNAYRLITGRYDIDEIIEADLDVLFFPFNPFVYDNDDIQSVIDYFESEDREDYEKCGELLKCKTEFYE